MDGFSPWFLILLLMLIVIALKLIIKPREIEEAEKGLQP